MRLRVEKATPKGWLFFLALIDYQQDAIFAPNCNEMKIEKKHVGVIYLIGVGLVLAIWYTKTQSGNYYQGEGEPSPQLLQALSHIFMSKVLFWSVFFMFTFLTINFAYRRRFKKMFIFAGISILSYIAGNMYTNHRCAAQYYTVLQHQKVAAKEITKPIKEAGYDIGGILADKVTDKNEPYRYYEIQGLGHLKYKPATNAITTILKDNSEPDSTRVAAYHALKRINTTKSVTIAREFRKGKDPNSNLMRLIDAVEE